MITQEKTIRYDPYSWQDILKEPWMPPVKLNTFSGIHPRLLLNENRVRFLESRIESEGCTHRNIFEFIKDKVDAKLMQMKIPCSQNDQDQMRDAGNWIPWMGLVYLIAKDRKYLNRLKDWILAVCSYERWHEANSLAAGHLLFGASIGYDWLYDNWSPGEKKIIQEKLKKQATEMIISAPVHHDIYLANHPHVEYLGLAAAGFALFDVLDGTMDWIKRSFLFFKTAVDIGPEYAGASAGHSYWAYMMESLLRYAEMAKDLLGVDFYNAPLIKSVSSCIIYSTLPNFNRTNNVMSFGDSKPHYNCHGPCHILYRVAAEYNNGYAQQLANEMFAKKAGIDTDKHAWLNLLWHDETVQPEPLENLSTFWACKDIGWVTSRSSWNPDAVMVGFKCGHFHSQSLKAYYDRQIDENWPLFHRLMDGHGHADATSFSVYGYGKWLVNDFYVRGSSNKSREHNLITINGKGQIGESDGYFDAYSAQKSKASALLVKYENKKKYDYFVGDAGNIYPEGVCLEKYLRHIIILKPNVIIIVDEIKTRDLSKFDWLLHSPIDTVKRINQRRFKLDTGDRIVMDIDFLAPDNISVLIEKGRRTKLVGRVKNVKEANFIVVLNPKEQKDAVLGAYFLGRGKNIIKLRIDSEKVKANLSLNLNKKEVALGL
jgi:hypothetical protein